MQQDILTLTLNPALDLAAEAPQVVPAIKLRLSEPSIEPGGGGINVARAIRQLGGSAGVLAALGGVTGARLAEALRGEGIEPEIFAIAGETRQSLVVTDAGDGRQFRFIQPGPQWTAAQGRALLEHLKERLRPDSWLVLSGSQPPGLAPDFAVDLARQAAQSGARLVVDISGEPLRALIDAGQAVTCLRLDQAEAEAQAGHPLASAADSLAFAEALVARGAAQLVVLARGAEGSVLAGQGQRLRCQPPSVRVLSRTGAGDSFTAGFTLALARGEGPGAALALGTAAAAAAVMTPGSALCRRADTEALLPQCRLRAEP